MICSIRKTASSVVLAGLCFALAAGAAASPTRLACVGDSITFGFGLKDRARQSYPARLQEWLGSAWRVRNFGVSATTLLHKGDRPYIKQKAYARALEFKPDVVVIMLGTNDSKHRGPGSLDDAGAVNNWQYKADYIPDYEALIAAFRKANPAVKVCVCLPTPCFPGRWGINGATIRDEIIPKIRQVAGLTHARVIDLFHPLLGKGNLFPDTVHPNAEGARLMAAVVYRALTGKPAPSEPAATRGSRHSAERSLTGATR